MQRAIIADVQMFEFSELSYTIREWCQLIMTDVQMSEFSEFCYALRKWCQIAADAQVFELSELRYVIRKWCQIAADAQVFELSELSCTIREWFQFILADVQVNELSEFCYAIRKWCQIAADEQVCELSELSYTIWKAGDATDDCKWCEVVQPCHSVRWINYLLKHWINHTNGGISDKRMLIMVMVSYMYIYDTVGLMLSILKLLSLSTNNIY